LHTNRTYRPPRSPLADTAQFLILIAVLSWLLFQSAGNLNYNWQWYRVSDFLFVRSEEGFRMGPLLLGLGVTIKISAVSLVCTLVIGLMTALFRLSNSPVASLLARIYLEIIRNTPLLIQIYLIYYVLGPVLGLERFPAAVLALSLFQGAYASEIIRSGILAVDRGQTEAARSLGLNKGLAYRLVILPQALRTILPPLTSQAISLIKDSALVSTIAIYDLVMNANALVAETFLTFEIWFLVALLYLMITISLSLFVAYLEKRVRYR
jgi:polar amino acid transport system permease protein